MLTIYTDEDLVISTYVHDANDSYFQCFRSEWHKDFEAEQDRTVKNIVKNIDHGEFTSYYSVKTPFGSCSIDELSTGCHTVLNIYYHPELCFDTISCGNNALKEILKLESGQALMRKPPRNKYNYDFKHFVKLVTKKGTYLCRDFDSLMNGFNME